MLPEEIHATSAVSSKFKYSHPLNRSPVDDGSMRARLAYDLMTFMGRDDCPYFMTPEAYASFDPTQGDDEVDIMIVDGFYKEAKILIGQKLEENPDDDKALFQQAFIEHLRQEYEKMLVREELVLANDPQNVSALINKGFALANLDREEEALTLANKALRIAPDNLTLLGNKAYIEKILYRDEMREDTLKLAYNVSAKNRMREIAHLESKLLKDFESVFFDLEEASSTHEDGQSQQQRSSTAH